MKNKRKKIVGTKAEDMAASYLRDNGYEIILRNYKCKLGEIDMIARDGECLVFVEVRSRSSQKFGTPEQSMSGAKKKRLQKLAQYYMWRELRKEVFCRFDLVGIEFDGHEKLLKLNHLIGINL